MKHRKQRFLLIAEVAKYWGLTISEVRLLKMWQLNELVTEMNKQRKREQESRRNG